MRRLVPPSFLWREPLWFAWRAVKARPTSLCVLAYAVFLVGPPVAAQTADPIIERITFDDAVRRAVANNPTVAQAASGILRSEAVLQQARAATLPSLNANLTTNVIGPVPSFAGEAITPRTQLNTRASLASPLFSPVLWARRTQAADQVIVSERATDDVRKEIAVATAQAYLAVITERRVLELNERARDNARAHYDYADQRFQGGLGSRLNARRAQQELSGDEARVEDARLAVRRAQEALGVLVASDRPIDAAGQPGFDIPADVATAGDAPIAGELISPRTDVRLLTERTSAAVRVLRDSRLEYLPSVTGLLAPQLLTPAGLFSPSRSWSGTVLFSIPLFEAGQRKGARLERQSQLDAVRAQLTQTERAARSEVRAALEAVRSTEKALTSAQAAAAQANEVVQITDTAFRAGATTNIELIDAQRGARDADTAAAIAEDAVRRARLEVLVAIGRFPN